MRATGTVYTTMDHQLAAGESAFYLATAVYMLSLGRSQLEVDGSAETGRSEFYVRGCPRGSATWRVSDAGRVGLNPEHGYDLFGNGDRILIVREEGASAATGDLTLVTGWKGR